MSTSPPTSLRARCAGRRAPPVELRAAAFPARTASGGPNSYGVQFRAADLLARAARCTPGVELMSGSFALPTPLRARRAARRGVGLVVWCTFAPPVCLRGRRAGAAKYGADSRRRLPLRVLRTGRRIPTVVEFRAVLFLERAAREGSVVLHCRVSRCRPGRAARCTPRVEVMPGSFGLPILWRARRVARGASNSHGAISRRRFACVGGARGVEVLTVQIRAVALRAGIARGTTNSHGGGVSHKCCPCAAWRAGVRIPTV